MDVEDFMSSMKVSKEDLYWELDVLELNGIVTKTQLKFGTHVRPLWKLAAQ